MKIKVTMAIDIPRVPNFFLMESGEKVPISAIEESGLREIGKQWTENLIKRANEQGKGFIDDENRSRGL